MAHPGLVTLKTLALASSFVAVAAALPLACVGGDGAGPAATPAGDAGPTVPDDAGTTPDGAAEAATGDGAVTVLTVSGRVSYNVYDQPTAGATVTIGNATVTTNAAGAFTIPNVTAPYDLSVSYAIGGKTFVRAFEGLTRPDPVIELASYSPSPTLSATINGTVAGTYPLGANRGIKIVTRGQNGGTATQTISDTAIDGTFSILPQWRDAGMYDAKVYAVSYEADADGVPTSWLGVGAATVTVTSGQVVDDIKILLADPTESNVAATLAQPAATEAASGAIAIQFEPGCAMEFRKTVAGPFAVTVPSLSALGAGPFVYAYVTAPYSASTGSVFESRTQVTSASTLAFDTRSPLTPLPASGTVVTPATELSWDARGAGPYTVRFTSSAGAPVYVVTTRKSTLEVPPSVAAAPDTYTWRVSHYYATASVDAFAEARGYSDLKPRVHAPDRTLVVQ